MSHSGSGIGWARPAASDSAARDGAEGLIREPRHLQQNSPEHRWLFLSSLWGSIAAMHRRRRDAPGLGTTGAVGRLAREHGRGIRILPQSRDCSFEPGKPIWLTETAEAACGGNQRHRAFSTLSATSTSLAGLRKPPCRW